MTWVLFIMIWGSGGNPMAQHIGGFSSMEECKAAAEVIKKAETMATWTKAACISQRTNKGT